MSAEKQSLTLTYTPLVGGDGESRWIRLEQEEPEDETLSMEEAAAIIDELYGIEPCDDGMGGGGEEAAPENEPDEEEFDEVMAEMLRRAGICKQPKWWEGVVRVYRSHKRPGYVLRSETAEVRKTEPARESHRQEVDASGAVIELEMPYDGGLTGIPAGVKWTVRGSTVNLDRQISGHLVLRYNTYYERVTMRVPTKVQPEQWRDGMGRASLNPIDISGKTSGDDATERTELPSASVVAIQGDIAASCEMTPPPVDESVDEATIKKICGRDEDDPPHDKGNPQDCWKTIRHYQLCECTKQRVNEWEEKAGAPCDGAKPGGYVGLEEHFDGYAGGDGCDGYEPELRTPEFYRKHCCKPLPFSTSRLPGCREYYSVYRGGAAIENGTEHWKNLYGPNVRLVAVLPESGICGDVITSWNIPSKNCCDEAEPLTPDPGNPEEIEPGQTYWIGVEGGLPGYAEGEMTWQASGGLEFADNGETTLKTPHGTKRVRVRARPNICPEPAVRVDDGCSSLTMTFRGEEGEGPRLSETDMAVSPETEFSLGVSGGVPGYMWQASGGLTILGWSADGSIAYFRTGAIDEWCVATVTVVDQCGRSASCAIRNAATGSWRQMAENEYDPCNPPGAPFPPMSEAERCYANQQNVLNGGYRANISGYGRSTTGCERGTLPCPVGTFLTLGYEACTQEECQRGRNTWLGNGCCKSRLSELTMVGAQRVVRLWKWVCGDA